MRFVLKRLIIAIAVILGLGISLPVWAQPGQEFQRSNRTASPILTGQRPPLTLQRNVRGPTHVLKTRQDLTLNEVATGLGDISALALGEAGDIFTLDRQKGRLYRLGDRGQDGEIDMRLPLAIQFDAPTGLSICRNSIFVADLNAIWQISLNGQKTLFVSLDNAKASPIAPKPLLCDIQNNRLILGLNPLTGHSKIIAIDLSTQTASNLGEMDAKLSSLALSPSGDIWLGSRDSLHILGRQKSYPIEQGQDITGFILPGADTPEKWPAYLQDHIILAQSARRIPPFHSGPHPSRENQSGGMNLISIPTTFGTLDTRFYIFVDGFLSARGHAAWGHPGPMIMDKRGLFFADRWQGSLWRVSPRPAKKANAKSRLPEPPIDDNLKKPNPNQETLADEGVFSRTKIRGSQITGSQIKGSQIGKASNLPYGSQQIKDFNLRQTSKKSDDKANPATSPD